MMRNDPGNQLDEVNTSVVHTKQLRPSRKQFMWGRQVFEISRLFTSLIKLLFAQPQSFFPFIYQLGRLDEQYTHQ